MLTSDPREPHSRIVWLDVLRGFALFGIAQVNFAAFAAGEVPIATLMGGAPSATAQAFYAVIQFAVTAKFYPVFAFLFGYGHFLQRRSLAARGIVAQTILVRRYLMLLAIGVVHGTLFFFGDILTLYAIAGLLLTLTHRTNLTYPRQMLLWAILGTFQLTLVYSVPGDPALAKMLAVHANELSELAEGQLVSVMSARASLFLSSQVSELAFFLPILLMLMNAGQWAASIGVWERPDLHRRLFGCAFAIGMVIGVPLNLAFAGIALSLLKGEHASGWWSAADLLSDVAFVLSLAWLGLLGLWAGRRGGRISGILMLLSCTGRMALTNYLTQSVVMAVLWYSFWPWLVAHDAYPCLCVIAFVVCLIQMGWSYRRVTSGQAGPAEVLWRRVTYAPLRDFE